MTNTSPSPKDQIRAQAFSALSELAQAMATPVRLRIIQILSNSPASVEELSDYLKESVANTSQHLQKLKKAGLVIDSKRGMRRIYSLINPHITDAFLQFQSIASEIMPKAQAAEKEICPPELCPNLPLERILADVQAKKAILLDVRYEKDFDATPIPMAIFFPKTDFAKNLGLLSKRKRIYAFCRGRYCSMANDIVRELRKRGYQAYRLREMSYEIEQAITKE